MWARVLEVAVGLWLALSPFVFRHAEERTGLWIHDYVCATVVVVLALLSYGHRARRAHLGELAVGAWLVGHGWLAARELATPASQNHLVVGVLLLMLAIVPSEASDPPPEWRELRRGHGERR